jgi:hypothetical protein
MKITVDPKVLIETLQSYNAALDLTGVKAYLFDQLLGEDFHYSAVKETKPSNIAVAHEKPKDAGSQTSVFAEDRPPQETSLAQELPAGIIGESSAAKPKASKVVIRGGISSSEGKGSPGKTTAEQRAVKRAEMKKFSDMSSRELLEHLGSQSSAARGEHNQYISEGVDSKSSGNDELEIG